MAILNSVGIARAAASVLDAVEHGRGPCVRLAAKLGVHPVVDGWLELDLGNFAGEGTTEGHNSSFGKATLDERTMGLTPVDFGIVDLVVVMANVG